MEITLFSFNSIRCKSSLCNLAGILYIVKKSMLYVITDCVQILVHVVGLQEHQKIVRTVPGLAMEKQIASTNFVGHNSKSRTQFNRHSHTNPLVGKGSHQRQTTVTQSLEALTIGAVLKWRSIQMPQLGRGQSH
jgi:hypothetical protein